MIPAIEEAMVGMKVGGVRRLIVPQELGYPGQPPDFTKQGPTPGNFSVSPNSLQQLCVMQCRRVHVKEGRTCAKLHLPVIMQATGLFAALCAAIGSIATIIT